MPAVSCVAQQVKVPAEEWAAYDCSGRAIKRHRMETRGAFGFRECTAEDQAQLAEWLPPELSGDVSEKLVAAWRARAAKEYPSELRTAAGPVRYTLLSTPRHVRETEITDSLVELFIQLVQKINTWVEKKAEGEFSKEPKRVRGKEGILLRLAGAAVARLQPAPPAEECRIRAAVPANGAGQDQKWPNPAPVLSARTIDWDLTAQQYDQIVKYTSALRLGTGG